VGKLAITGGSPLRTQPFPAWPMSTREEAAALDDVLTRTKWGGQPFPGKHSIAFAKKFAEVHTAKYAQCVNTGTVAIQAALKAIPWLINSDVAAGGPLMDLGVYCVNTTRWLVDEDPIEVDARSWRRDPTTFRDVEQGIAFTLRFPSGLVAQATSSYGAVLSSHLFIQGTKGWLSLAPAFTFDEERKLTGKIAGKWIQRKFAVVDEFVPELDAFAGAIQRGAPIEPSGDQGHRDVIILNMAYESAKKATPVLIRYN